MSISFSVLTRGRLLWDKKNEDWVLLKPLLQDPVTVDYTAVEGTAKVGEDYVHISGTITFPAGSTNDTKHIFSIPILDNVKESKETFSVKLITSSEFALAWGNPTKTNTIVNVIITDRTIEEHSPSNPPLVNVKFGGSMPPPAPGGLTTPSPIMFKTTSLSLSEDGTITYQVRSTASRGIEDIIVNIETAHSGITVNPSKLMFTPFTWQDYQAVTAAADKGEQASILHSIPGQRRLDYLGGFSWRFIGGLGFAENARIEILGGVLFLEGLEFFC